MRVDTLLATAQHEFPVVDAFRKPVGLLTREDILTAVRKHGGERAGERLHARRRRGRPPGGAGRERVRAAADPKAAALYVTDADGAIVGLLTRQALAEVVLDPFGAAGLALRPAGVRPLLTQPPARRIWPPEPRRI